MKTNSGASVAQQRSADGHEQAVNVGLAMHDCSCSLRPGIGLVQLEIRRIGNHNVKRMTCCRCGKNPPMLRSALACASTKSLRMTSA